MVDLVFESAASTSHDLVYGDIGTPVANHFVLSGIFPRLTGKFSFIPNALMTLAATMPGITFATISATYDTHTERPQITQSTTWAQIGQPVEWGINHVQQIAQPYKTGASTAFTETNKTSDSTKAAYSEANNTRNSETTSFQDANRLQANDHLANWQDGIAQRTDRTAAFQDANRLTARRLIGHFEDGLKDRRITILTRSQVATPRIPLGTRDIATYANAINAAKQTRFEDARRAPAGISPTPITPIIPPEYWGTNLLFSEAYSNSHHLVFGISTTPTGQATYYILPARYYMTAHTITATRLPDNTNIPIYGASVTSDVGSYCWSFSATGPVNLFDLLAPVDGLPAQLRITMDGIQWVFAVDSISRTAAFGKTAANIKGRSVTSLIAEPYKIGAAYNNATDMTAQQIALSILTPEGIDLDWGIGNGALANGGLIDWLIPAGAFSHHCNPLYAINAIAQAAGGYLQSHRSAATLLTRHPYGTRTGDYSGAPWDWMTGPADIELATDALITESVERKDGPTINGVYVSGTTVGVLALVKRAGTAGDLLSSMISDQHITHADAARQRGLSVLGASGPKYNVSIELPVLTGTGQPGVIDVGQLVQINASTPWRGRVRSVSVTTNRPTLRQTITLERHL